MRDWLSHRVTASPDDAALVRAEDGETWTYAGLDRLVAEMTGRLAAVGVEPGDHLGVLLPTSVGYVGLIHAAMRLGTTLVPLGGRLTPRELAARLDSADVTTLVCGGETEADAVAAAERAVEAGETGPDRVPVVSVDEPDHDGVKELHAADPAEFEPPGWRRADRLCILFTSGTTGDPKPVDIRAGNVLASAVASAFRLGVDPDDRWLVTLSLHHMGGLAPIYRSTLYGTTVVLRESFEPGGAADDVGRHDVTGVSLVPTMLRRMLDRRGTLADSLRFVLLGGAPASEGLIDRCQRFHVPVYPTYGMTETASQIATATPDEAFDRTGTAGRPLFRTEVTVVDDAGEPVERGEAGELVVSGPTVSPGYYGRPDATDAAYGDHGLHTGDVGYLDEAGYVYVLNRRDDRIITGGENVDPGEVVEVLAAHPDVTEAAVVGLDDPEWGERVAALVVREGERLSASGLLASARGDLAGFKLPRTVAFADELPRTVSGTVDREAVRERLLADGFEPERPSADEDAVPPGDEPADAAEGDEATVAEDDGTADSGDGEEPQADGELEIDGEGGDESDAAEGDEDADAADGEPDSGDEDDADREDAETDDAAREDAETDDAAHEDAETDETEVIPDAETAAADDRSGDSERATATGSEPSPAATEARAGGADGVIAEAESDADDSGDEADGSGDEGSETVDDGAEESETADAASEEAGTADVTAEHDEE